MADGFLGRWSRRKLDQKEGKPAEAELPPAAVPMARAAPAPAPGPAGSVASAPAPVPAAAAEPPPPSLEDVAGLTPDSDFSRFTGAQVEPQVSNAAMKKLFADPRFNVMDGLDIYIDDYGKPDPLPAGMLRQMASTHFLGFFRDEDKAAAGPIAPLQPGTPPEAAPPQSVAQSGAGSPEPAAPTAPTAQDADPDLRLQQDHAPGPEGPGSGAG